MQILNSFAFPRFSGHDIKLLVTAASMEPCREVLQRHGGLKFMMNKSNEISQDLRNLTKVRHDFDLRLFQKIIFTGLYPYLIYF